VPRITYEAITPQDRSVALPAFFHPPSIPDLQPYAACPSGTQTQACQVCRISCQVTGSIHRSPQHVLLASAGHTPLSYVHCGAAQHTEALCRPHLWWPRDPCRSDRRIRAWVVPQPGFRQVTIHAAMLDVVLSGTLTVTL
jgi:hypothetical protein